MTALLEVKQGDTYTTWIGLLGNVAGWIDLSTATAVKMVAKLQNGSTLIGPVTTTITAKQSFTANLVSGSNVLSSVSAFTNITVGSTITGAGIPVLAVVGALDTVAQTITLEDTSGNALNATKTATGEALVANQGMVTYQPLTADTANAGVYNCEFYCHLPGGLLPVPNKSSANPTLTIDTALDLAGE